MLGAIYVGLSGMNAFSQGLQTISNNVANLNTSGFKATSASFTDMYSYGGGGLTYSSPGQQGQGGVRLATPATDFSQGDLRPTEGDLDLAIQGRGFLVLKDGDKTLFTRTGQFGIDKDGFITLQGTTMRLGVLNAAQEAQALNIDSRRTSAPAATTVVRFADNLSSTATDATISNITVFDANGGKHTWQVKFTIPTPAVAGSWTVTVTDEANATVGSGTIKFNGSIADPDNAKVQITANTGQPNQIAVTLDFTKGVTSFSTGSVSSLRAASVDGRATGTLSGVTVDADGQVKLTYSNGKTDLAGAVALADIRDPQELRQIGGGLFENTGSGPLRLVASASEGSGKIVSRSLEASNVNLSQEFGELILIQRGFQASSQVVSVANDMIQQLFGIRGQG